MQVGITLRSMGDESTPAMLAACTRRAEAAGLNSVWVQDHIAIPPDDAEGSNGRYLDPLSALAWLGGMTNRVKLGTGVLILPYRPPLATAKTVATIAELTGDRLVLGVGIGWMESEFRAVGRPRRARGRDSDAVLAFLRECFDSADDVVSANGQAFLFRPKPARPPIYVGGAAPHALARIARYGDGWLPMGARPDRLAAARAQYREIRAGIDHPLGPEELDSIVMARLPDDASEAEDLAGTLAELGVSELVASHRYRSEADFAATVESAATLLAAVG